MQQENKKITSRIYRDSYINKGNFERLMVNSGMKLVYIKTLAPSYFHSSILDLIKEFKFVILESKLPREIRSHGTNFPTRPKERQTVVSSNIAL